jgi:putative DNA-invertase from lambdoid prophage Rac
MRAVIYSRVSTDEQNAANQLPALKEYSRARGYLLGEIYSENESAWAGGHQKELARLFLDAKRAKFDIVLVWALDRLSREGSLAILELVNKLKHAGVKLYSYSEPWTDAPGEIGELLYSITGWIARMESKRRSERTRAGLARLKSTGRVLGRPPGSKDTRKRKRRA